MSAEDPKGSTPRGAISVGDVLGFFSTWRTSIAAVAALTLASVNLLSLWSSRALVVTPILTAIVVAVAAQIYFASESTDSGGGPVKTAKYARGWRRAALVFLVGVPALLLLSLCAYAAWLMVPSNDIVVTTTHFNAANASSPIPCDIGAALADNLDAAVENTNTNITVQHINYTVPGWGRSAHTWAKLFGRATKSNVIIYGSYWQGKGYIVVEPRIEQLQEFKKLSRAHRLQSGYPPVIKVSSDDICITGMDPSSGSLFNDLEGFAFVLVGLVDYEQGKHDAAITALEKSVRSQDIGYHDLAWYYLALCYGEVAKYDKALAYADLSLKSGNALAALNRGAFALNVGRADEAHRYFQQAIDIDPGLIWARVNLASVERYELGQYALASAHYRDATSTRVDRGDPSSLDAAARGYMASETSAGYEQAVRYLNDAIKIEPAAEDYDSLGDALRALQRYPEAVAAYTKAIEAEPGSIQYRLDRGRTRHENPDDTSSGDEDYRAAVNMRARNDDEYVAQAEAFEELGDYRGAVASADSALRLNKKNANALNHLAFAELKLGDVRAAKRAAETTIRLRPRNGFAASLLGSVHEALHHTDEAVGFHRRAAAEYRSQRSKDDCVGEAEALRRLSRAAVNCEPPAA